MNWLLFILPAAIQTLLVARLVSTGLARRYPAFTAWMTTFAISTIVLLAVPRQTASYRNIWIASQVVSTLVLFAALLELSSRIFEHYPGLRRVSASGLFGLLVAASIVAAAGETMAKPVTFFLMLQGGWNAATSGYVIVLVGLASYLDPRRRRNVILHERVFAFNFAISAAFLLFAAINPEQKEVSTWVGAASAAIFPLLWMRMSPAGEVDRRPPVDRSVNGSSFAETQATLERLENLVTRSGG